MNRQTDNDENRANESWLSSLARVYGTWHLGITAIQSVAWSVFVYWNESGKRDAWSDAVQSAGEKSWLAIPAFFITSMIILAGIQKGGRMVLAFIDERRKKLARARAEGRAEGHVEGREEGLAEGRAEVYAEAREEVYAAYAAWTDWNRRREEAEGRGERFDEPPPSLNGR